MLPTRQISSRSGIGLGNPPVKRYPDFGFTFAKTYGTRTRPCVPDFDVNLDTKPNRRSRQQR
jgi:hypothetical protein